MFDLRRERHGYVDAWVNDRKQVEHIEVQLDADVLVREDGFKLIRFGLRHGHRFFRYVKGHVAFDFYAARTHEEGTVTEMWLVTINLRPGQPFGDAVWPVERERFAPIAADIDAALRHWPAYPEDQGVPVETVIVDAGAFGFEFRPPRAMPPPPSSMRWQRQFLDHGWRHPTGYREALVRDDGVTLIHVLWRGLSDELDTYVYRDAQATSFEFTAERFLGRRPTETWEVDLTPMWSSRRVGLTPAQSARLGPSRVSEILAAIEEGLLAWLLLRPISDLPARRVVFVAKDIALPIRRSGGTPSAP